MDSPSHAKGGHAFFAIHIGSPLGICLITSCAAALVGGWIVANWRPQNGPHGPHGMPTLWMFGAAVVGPLISAKRLAYAISLAILISIFGCVWSDEALMMNGLFDARIGPIGVVAVLSFAAISAAGIFAIIDREADCWMSGAVGVTMGMIVWMSVATWASERFPSRLVVVEMPLFLSVIAFGPAMGLATGLPAGYFIARAKLEQFREGNRKCLSCGYDLRVSGASTICPECGEEIVRSW